MNTKGGVFLNATLEKERIHSLDVIRGIAIFGIFFVNIPSMLHIADGLFTSYTGIDSYIRLFYDLFIQTKFYSIFSLLFGLGAFIFMERSEQKGNSYQSLFVRRMFFLFLFGMIHYIFLWNGDILHTYAFTGIFLLFFYKRSPRTILITACSLMFIYLFVFAPIFFNGTYSYIAQDIKEYNFYHDWISITKESIHIFPSKFVNELVSFPKFLSLFLFGFYFGKIKFFEKTKQYRKHINYGICITLIVGMLAIFPIREGFLNDAFYMSINYYFWILLSGKILSIFYILCIIKLLDFDKTKKIVLPFRYVGKTAFSNYILQTIFSTVIIFLFIKNNHQITLWQSSLLVIVFFLFQMVISKLWLRYYRFGPLEWLWRTLTYRKKQPFKK